MADYRIVAADGSPLQSDEARMEQQAMAVRDFEHALHTGGILPFTVEDVRRELRGHDLGCWCSLGLPCHADVLLEVANS